MPHRTILQTSIEHQSEPHAGYSWKQLAKMAAVFTGTVGSFLAIKSTGSFGLLSKWAFGENVDLDTKENDALSLTGKENQLGQYGRQLLANEENVQELLSPAIVQKNKIEGLKLAEFKELPVLSKEPRSIAKRVVPLTGEEFLINTYTAGSQSESVVETLPNGKFVVVWTGEGASDSVGIYGQMYNSDGTKYNSEFRINSVSGSNPRVSKMSDGGFVVGYYDYDQDIRIKRYDSVGAVIGTEINTGNPSNIYDYFDIAGIQDNNFILVKTTGHYDTIVYFRFDSNGNVIGDMNTLVNDSTSKYQPNIVTLTNGNFIVTWRDGTSPNCNIHGIICAIDSSIVKSEFILNQAGSYQGSPSVAALPGGGFVTVWHDDSKDTSGYGIYGQRYDATGTAVGVEFRANTNVYLGQLYPSVVVLSDGGFDIFWHSDWQDESGYGIYGQRFAADGSKISTEFRVNRYKINDQTFPTAAAFIDDNVIVTWTSDHQDGSGNGIYGRFIPINAPLLSQNMIRLDQGGSVILTLSDIMATDPDTNDALLNFTVSDILHGSFELTTNSGVAITDFTQQQIIDGVVTFIHDDSTIEPSYNLMVSDGTNSSALFAADVHFTLSPLPVSVPVTGEEFLINTYTTGSQSNSVVETLPNGKFVVVWNGEGVSDSTGVYGQMYNSDGTKYNSEFRINDVASYTQDMPRVSKMSDGGFIVAYYDTYGTDGIRIKRYDSAGAVIGSEINAGNPANLIDDFGIAGIQDENFILAATTGHYDGVWYLRFDSNGDVIGDWNTLVSDSTSKYHPNIVTLTNGNFIITWRDGTSPNCNIHGIICAIDNTIVKSEFIINQAGIDQGSPSVAALPGGGFVSVWQSDGQDGSSWGIYGQRYDATGTAVGAEFRVNTNLLNDQVSPDVTSLSDGSFVVVWQTKHDDVLGNIHGQKFAADGSKIDDEFILNGNVSNEQSSGKIAAFNDDSLIAVWTSVDQDGSESGIYGRRIAVTTYPALSNNQLTLLQGDSVNLNSTMLSATDSNDPDETLVFKISDLLHGQFELISAPGVSITSFTQQQVIDGNVTFVHDDSRNSPEYKVAVSDPLSITTPLSATINFTPLNVAPTIEANEITIAEGEVLQITPAMLMAEDLDGDALTFNTTNVQHGYFSDTNIGEVTSFTSTDIADGKISFVHDGSEYAPGYNITVSDGIVTSASSQVVVHFTNVNDAPVLTENTLTISEGATVQITDLMLSATDVDNTVLTYIISDIEYGYFSNTDSGEVTSFTSTDIADGKISFIHDGSEFEPSYRVAVSDGTLTSTPSQVVVDFTNVNDAPVLTENTLTISEGATVQITNLMLSATDAETTVLTYTISEIAHGYFSNTDSGEVTSFTSTDIVDGKISFVHDGSEFEPSYKVAVSDGTNTTSPQKAAITFNNQADANMMILPIAIATAVGSVLCCVGVAVSARCLYKAGFFSDKDKVHEQKDDKDMVNMIQRDMV